MIYAATGILTQGHTVLMTQRGPHKSFPGFWEFPGGKIESDEDSLQALIRELKEEIGITIRNPNYLFTYQHAYPDQMVSVSFWHVADWAGEIQAMENQSCIWLGWDELNQFKVLPGTAAVMQRLRELIC